MRGPLSVIMASFVVSLFCAQASSAGASEVYVVIMDHVEGDSACSVRDSACLTAIQYQTARLPPAGMASGQSYALDVAGTDLMYRILSRYSDSQGRKPKLFIEPTGEWWQTFVHPLSANKAFGRYDYLALGNEFGIQAHAIEFSGVNYGWYGSSHSAEGVARRLEDADYFARQAASNGIAVNRGTTFTGGWKFEQAALGGAWAEYLIDHAAYGLGYRVSFEDHDGHIQDEPSNLFNLSPAPFVYRAVYPDGVSMIKLDMNGPVDSLCKGNTPRCEQPAEAAARFDRTLEARATDPDPRKVYFFGFVNHANNVWNNFNAASLPGQLPPGEGDGLRAIMDHIQLRVAGGADVRFATPAELAAIFEANE